MGNSDDHMQALTYEHMQTQMTIRNKTNVLPSFNDREQTVKLVCNKKSCTICIHDYVKLVEIMALDGEVWQTDRQQKNNYFSALGKG